MKAEITGNKNIQGKSLWYYSWKRLKKNKLAMAGLVIIFIMIFIALLADVISPYNPNDQILEFATKPVNFEGTVLLKKSDNNESGFDYLPINNFLREENDSVYYEDFNRTERSINTNELISLTGTSTLHV